eukprot:110525-Prorocentrum_minimum.AAC.2
MCEKQDITLRVRNPVGGARANRPPPQDHPSCLLLAGDYLFVGRMRGLSRNLKRHASLFGPLTTPPRRRFTSRTWSTWAARSSSLNLLIIGRTAHT